jgi:hypothetical protein
MAVVVVAVVFFINTMSTEGDREKELLRQEVKRLHQRIREAEERAEEAKERAEEAEERAEVERRRAEGTYYTTINEVWDVTSKEIELHNSEPFDALKRVEAPSFVPRSATTMSEAEATTDEEHKGNQVYTWTKTHAKASDFEVAVESSRSSKITRASCPQISSDNQLLAPKSRISSQTVSRTQLCTLTLRFGLSV